MKIEKFIFMCLCFYKLAFKRFDWETSYKKCFINRSRT